MAKPAILTFENEGRSFRSLGALVSHASQEEVGRIRHAASVNMRLIMDLLGDVWVDIVQKAVVKKGAVPAHRGTIILRQDIGQRMMTFGWQDFRGNAKARFNGERVKPMMYKAMRIALASLPTGVRNEAVFDKAQAQYRINNLIASAVGKGEDTYLKSVGKDGGKFGTTRRLTHKGMTKRRKS